jgi:hypothetical protein
MPVSQGASVLVALKHALREEFLSCGNRHWDTHTDCNDISEHFDVGMLIFADSLQTRGAQCLVNVHALRGGYAYLIALWWDDPAHFRLAQYREGTPLPWRSFWRAADLPPSLRAHYDLCNPTAPVGSARRLGLNPKGSQGNQLFFSCFILRYAFLALVRPGFASPGLLWSGRI